MKFINEVKDKKLTLICFTKRILKVYTQFEIIEKKVILNYINYTFSKLESISHTSIIGNK